MAQEQKKNGYELKTRNGYPLPLVRSALQKCVRYADEIHAGYWLVEMVESGYTNYALTTLANIAVEDGYHPPTLATVMPILNFYKALYKEKKTKAEYRPALGTVLLLLCRQPHSRAGDNFWCYISMKRQSGWRCEVPEFAYDEHIAEKYKKPHQLKRHWRFWVRICSVLANKLTPVDIGGNDYESEMTEYWLKNGNQNEPDYNELNPIRPYEPIVEKPFEDG